MTLSKNSKGTVIKTSTVGFSPKKIADKIIATLEKKGVSFDFDFSHKTGSQYLEFSVNGVDFTLRISNHTERYEGYVPLEVRLAELPEVKNSNVDFSVLTTEQAKVIYSLIK